MNSACISNNPHIITGNVPAKNAFGVNVQTTYTLDSLKPNTADMSKANGGTRRFNPIIQAHLQMVNQF